VILPSVHNHCCDMVKRKKNIEHVNILCHILRGSRVETSPITTDSALLTPRVGSLHWQEQELDSDRDNTRQVPIFFVCSLSPTRVLIKLFLILSSSSKQRNKHGMGILFSTLIMLIVISKDNKTHDSEVTHIG
jgi:hypothetical protein